MTKRLVICCDGTWNSPDQLRAGVPCPTNVTKLAKAVALKGADGAVQRVFYQKGVGTARWERIRGGAFGFGLSGNVREAYRFIVEEYEPGDELFLFGFSRGAFTARSTAGLVRNAGILRSEHSERLEEAYALYRSRTDTAHPTGDEAVLFRRSYSHETRIRFIGVWDTVGALGIPVSGLPLLTAFNRRWAFHDTQLSSSVDAAFHALAVDEQRRPFEATLWGPQEKGEGQRVEQVWFAGGHGNVGGGAKDSSLSDIALLWMMDRARSCGLTLHDPGTDVQVGTEPTASGPAPTPNALGKISNARTGVYRLWPPFHRPIGDTDASHEYAAKTVVYRREKDRGYAPPNLLTYLDENPQVMDV